MDLFFNMGVKYKSFDKERFTSYLLMLNVSNRLAGTKSQEAVLSLPVTQGR